MSLETTAGITEAASEKRTRGRPPIMDDTNKAAVAFACDRRLTQGGRLDVFYRLLAVHALVDDDRFAWLVDRPKMEAGQPGAWKPSILSELGRIQDVDAMRAAALGVCELKPKTKEAVAMIRFFRLRREPGSSFEKLVLHLARALDGYLTAHPSTPTSTQASVLRELAAFIEDQEEPGEA